MKLPDILNFAGIIVTGIGSTLATIGVFNQMNGYFSFAPRQLFLELKSIIGILFTKGKKAAIERVGIAADLAEGEKEDRTTSLIGFYFVLFGFFLQILGLASLAAALFASIAGAGK